MTHSFLFRLVVLTTLLAAPFPAEAQPEQKPPSVSVTGEANITAAPDIAIVQAGVTSQARTAREAMAGSGKLMTAVLAVFKDSGISEKDIKTSRLRLEPIYEPNKRPPAPIIAVEATSLITVRLREVNQSADILDKMIGAGANIVTGINFDISEPSKLLDQARVEALADARRKAEIYAKAASVTLGRPLSISEGYISRPRTADYLARSAPASMPIQAGEEKIGINVSVSYELLR